MMRRKTSKCQICDSPNVNTHFGAETCRACAAFFRRFVNSKRLTVTCKCDSNNSSRYACRLCRIKKCISIGMKKSLVQPSRDANSQKPLRNLTESSPIGKFISCIEYPIGLRNNDRLHRIQQNYGILINDRRLLNALDMCDEKMNMYELSCLAINDYNIMSKMLEKAFPELDEFGEVEKQKMCANFYPKWNVIEAAMYTIKKQESWDFRTPCGQPIHNIDSFYAPSNRNGQLTRQDVMRIFSQYWTYFTDSLIPEVVHQKLHNVEYMALLAVIFLDAGYSNLSEESVEKCRTLKTVYMKEFIAYYRAVDWEESGTRLFNVLHLLQHVEKGAAMNQEELEMCLLHGIKIDENYRKLITAPKY